jgi:acyl-CoA synthetase (AMP-forming)/AMP-acid ligase II
LGERVCAHLDLSLSAHEEREFEAGEHKARPLVNVRGREVFVLQSLYGDSQQSVNDKLCRLLFFLGALRDAAAATATRLDDNLIGSVGTPLKDVEVKLDAPNEAGLGEVLIRGPIVTPGYYHNAAANAAAFTADGWFGVRALAVQWNFHPYGPRLRHDQPQRVSPFHDVNGFVYHTNWLHNLLIASSMGGLRL